MAEWFKEEIDHMGDRLDDSIRLASKELQGRVDSISVEIATHRREGIAEVGDRMEQAIRLAGSEIQDRVESASRELAAHRGAGVAEMGERLDQSIRLAGSEIRERIDEISKELHSHRALTGEEIREIIIFASQRFGAALDERIDKAKGEISILVTEKLAETRGQMSAYVEEQKRATIRNVSFTLLGSVLIGGLSLLYQGYLHGGLNLINVFRALLFMAVGYQTIGMALRAYQNYRKASGDQKRLLLSSIQYFGVLRTEGFGPQIAILFLLLAALVLLNFWKPLMTGLAGAT